MKIETIKNLETFEKYLLLDTIGERLQKLTKDRETYYNNITLFHELKNLYERIEATI